MTRHQHDHQKPPATRWWLLVTLMLVTLTTIAWMSQSYSHPHGHPVVRIVQNILYGNAYHAVPCDRWPTRTETEATMAQHRDVIDAITAVNPRNIEVQMRPGCHGKADLWILYPGWWERIKIERILREPTFFGVPYNLINI